MTKAERQKIIEYIEELKLRGYESSNILEMLIGALKFKKF
jgi:hypothetical protein